MTTPPDVYADPAATPEARMLAAVAVQLARIAQHLEDRPAPAPQCAHGPRVRKTGDGAKGPWAGWFCPLPQDRSAERCAPVFDA